uniref:GtrA/DPMS transmembrane domain-containing protein n=1 Tax=uncultured Actinomycetes bacterium TaxID=152507 RepID=A0A871XZC8_9ACTN|nr:hypothetical protein HULAa32G3_00025 [uncultured Actinomycetes bacterium]
MRQVKFAAVGLLNTFVDFVVFNVLAVFVGMPVIPASVLGYSCGIVNSYVFNRNWTFADSGTKTDRTLVVKFLVTNLVGMAVNAAIVVTVSNNLLDTTTWDKGWVFAVSKVFATAGAFLVNYTLMHRWVFKTA